MEAPRRLREITANTHPLSRDVCGLTVCVFYDDLMRGIDAVEEHVELTDGRGSPLAMLWLCATANRALEAVCASEGVAVPMPPASQRMNSAEISLRLVICAVKLQRYSRGLLARAGGQADFQHRAGTAAREDGAQGDPPLVGEGGPLAHLQPHVGGRRRAAA